MSNVPNLGKIFFVRDGVVKSKNEVLDRWGKTTFVKSTGSIEAKGWLLDVLMCVERISKQEFSLDDVYAFAGYLKAKHPANHNVKAKMRQQLQILRDKWMIGLLGYDQHQKKLTNR